VHVDRVAEEDSVYEKPVFGSSDLRVVTCPAPPEIVVAIKVKLCTIEEIGPHPEHAQALGLYGVSWSALAIDVGEIVESESVDLRELRRKNLLVINRWLFQELVP